MSLFIAVFLFSLKSRSVPTVLLAWTFSAGALLNLSVVLEFACPYYWQPYNLKNLLIPIAQVVGPCAAVISLVLFAYYFPHFQNPDRMEFRIVVGMCIAADLAVLATAFHNFIVLKWRRSDYSFEQTFYAIFYAVLAVQFILILFLLLRKAVRFSSGKRRPWWLRLIRSRGSDALAARSLALVLCLPSVAVGGYVLNNLGVIPFQLATYFIWLVFLLFYFSFIITYLNHTVERTTFQVKLIGLALAFIVVILGLVSVVIGRSYAMDYSIRNLIADNQTIHYEPNRHGSYTVVGEALRFDTDLGSIVEIEAGAYQTLHLQFPFPFFDASYRTLQVLHGPMIYLGEEIRESGWGGYHPQPAIAPLIVNLDPARGGGIYLNSRSDRVTITWYRMPESGYDNRNTVQLALYTDGSFDISYKQLDIRSSYSAIRMYVFITANLTGLHPGASGDPVPSGPKLIGIHPGGREASLQPIRYSQDLPYVSEEPGVIFESYENDFNAYLQDKMSILVVVLVVSSLLVLFIFPLLLRTSLIKPLQALSGGMERADKGELDVQITPQFNDEIGALTQYFNRMLQSIREAEANFRALAANAQDGILIVLEDGQIAYANRGAQRISGRSDERLIDTPIQQVIHFQPGKVGSDQLWKDLGEKQQAKHLEGSVIVPGETLTPVEMTISKTYWHRMPAVVVMLRDISERLRREEQDRLYQQLMIQSDKLTTLGILATAVAHEINNPNQVILALIRILKRAWTQVHPNLTQRIRGKDQMELVGFELDEFLESVGGWLGDIEANSERINGIVQGLRSYIRDDSSPMSSVNLTTVVRSAVELIGYHIRTATDHFVLHLGRTIPNIRGNPQKIEQVIINLIMNSCQSLPNRDGSVECGISHDRKEGLVLLTVSDDGCGISDAVMGKIKEPLFTTRRAAGGTGLGLYIVDSIVQEHRGKLSITSAIGKGTTVVAAFPVEEGS